MQRLARQYGNDIVINQQTRRRPKPITQDKTEKRESSKPKARDDTWRSNSLKVATQKASEVLKDQNIQVPEKRIRQAFEKQPILRGSKEDVQRNLIALGKTDGPARDNASAFKRGLEKVFVSVLDSLAGKAHAGEIDKQRTLVHQNVRDITDNTLDHSGNIILRAYDVIDSFLKESHRLIGEADRRRENVYQQHPQLRQYERYYREGIQRFKTIVPEITLWA